MFYRIYHFPRKKISIINFFYFNEIKPMYYSPDCILQKKEQERKLRDYIVKIGKESNDNHIISNNGY